MVRFMSLALGRVAIIAPIAAALVLAAVACGGEDAPALMPASKSSEPGLYTRAFVEQAIERYESQGRDATIAYYNTPESVDGQWYVFIVDGDGSFLSQPVNPDLLGEEIEGMTDMTGYNFGADIVAATSEGRWIDYMFMHPVTGRQDQKHSWVVRHDGLIFGSGWYEAAVSRDGQGFEAGPLGAVEVAPGEAIQIRSMQVLTGIGDLGTPNQRGVEMALADYGPIHGRDVSMGAGLDALCTAEGGHAAAETVTGDPRIAGVIGTSCSVAAVAASPVLSEAGLVMISPSNTSPSLTSDLRGNAGPNYHPGYYRTSNNDLYGARAVAQFAYDDFGLRRIAAIHDGDPYTSGLTAAFTIAFEELGGSVSVASISRGDTDMVPTLTGIAAGGPDGLFFPLFQEEGTYIVKQVGQIAGLEDVTLIGGAALLVSEFLAVPESEGVYLPGPYSDLGGNTNEATGKSGEALVADYRDRYGEAPASAYLPHAYDAATMLLRAIEEVAVEDGDTLYIDRAKLREALTGITGFRGIIGVISCDEFGDCGTGGVQIAHHTDSGVTDVADLPVVYRFAP